MTKKTAASPPKPIDQSPADASSPPAGETPQPSGDVNPPADADLLPPIGAIDDFTKPQGSDVLPPVTDTTLPSPSQDPPPETNLPEAPAPAEHPAVAAVLDKLEDAGSLKEARAVLEGAVGDKANEILDKLSENTDGGREGAHEVIREAMGLSDPAGPKKYFATAVLRDGEALVQPGEEVTHLSGAELEELLARGAVELR